MFDNLLPQLWFQITLGFALYLLLGLRFASNLRRVQGPEFWAIGNSEPHITDKWKKVLLFVILALIWSLMAWWSRGSSTEPETSKLREIREALPIIGLIWKAKYRRTDKMEAARRRQEVEERAQKIHEKFQENCRRGVKRKAWLKENPPEFYYARQNGITAVLLPADYEKNRRYTQAARLTGEWGYPNLLRLVPETLVFANNNGAQYMYHHRSANPAYQAAEISRLTRILEAYPGAKLIEKEDIFVPYVNETVLPFEKQREILRRTQHGNDLPELIFPQVPKDLQPLPYDSDLGV